MTKSKSVIQIKKEMKDHISKLDYYDYSDWLENAIDYYDDQINQLKIKKGYVLNSFGSVNSYPKDIRDLINVRYELRQERVKYN